MKHSTLWCERHWGHIVAANKANVRPLNGMIATVDITTRFTSAMYNEHDAKGLPFPKPDDTAAFNKMLAEHEPICCYLGDDIMTLVYEESVVPEKYRNMPIEIGHRKHFMDATTKDFSN